MLHAIPELETIFRKLLLQILQLPYQRYTDRKNNTSARLLAAVASMLLYWTDSHSGWPGGIFRPSILPEKPAACSEIFTRTLQERCESSIIISDRVVSFINHLFNKVSATQRMCIQRRRAAALGVVPACWDFAGTASVSAVLRLSSSPKTAPERAKLTVPGGLSVFSPAGRLLPFALAATSAAAAARSDLHCQRRSVEKLGLVVRSVTIC